MPFTGEEKKAFQKEYMREYMRQKRLVQKGLNKVLTKNQSFSFNEFASQAKSREFESRLPLHQFNSNSTNLNLMF
jgi:hypothetical protein